jgi:hypothetical protein
MFVGHFAVAFGAKRALPSVSLGVLFLSCQLADLIWPTLLLLGLEIVEIDPGNTAFTPLNFVSYPYSHSLVGVALWSGLAGVVCAIAGQRRWAAAAAVTAVGISHWILDLITHRPDLPLTFSGSTRVGWGLWNSVPATIAVEVPMFLAGAFIYRRTTRARDRAGAIGLGALVVFLLLVYAVNVVSPPPPGPMAVAIAAQSMWLLVAWGFWVDRHRVPARPNG